MKNYYGWRIKDNTGAVIMYNAFKLHESPEWAFIDLAREFKKFKTRSVYNPDIAYSFEVVPIEMYQ